MKRFKRGVTLGAAFLAMGTGVLGEEITISAAISLKEPLDEIIKKYKVETGGVDEVFVNYGASSALRYQIENGAPVDIVLFADTINVDKLEEKKLIEKEERSEILYNSLLLVGTGEKVESLEELKGKRIAIGDPDTAPLGRYTKEFLENTGEYEKLKDDLILAKNAKGVFNYVESGDVDYGIIYKSEMKNLKNAKIIMEIDSSKHSKPIYGFGILEEEKEGANRFYDFVKGEKTKEIFMENGFKTLE